jgi:hypothetical protein
MQQNIGNADRLVRIVAGVALLVFGYTQKNWFGLIGIVPLATAFVRWCPLYTVFGFKTCKKS